MNIKSTFILFLILSFFSCKKENHKRWTEVVVHARDELSGDKIEDIECYILYTDYDTVILRLSKKALYSRSLKTI
ncbi:MAG: hypothetical protein WDZ35_12115 [Crocinitomicaceae bacterium]